MDRYKSISKVDLLPHFFTAHHLDMKYQLDNVVVCRDIYSSTESWLHVFVATRKGTGSKASSYEFIKQFASPPNWTFVAARIYYE